ncbi:hypothetical protein LPB72_01445 [Hydrogenophaga crassostreae]|uniref:histidine kinase n=1 Tax=Hydrogenophaga crassostreae TaxID=1763535 RepID=A0A170AKL9_9BURK|nr:ATP-binding protein [Hydrogenophaga crassostreae]AOW13849.1 hypothetical protein LPB072_14370 [Hydrogenophaga crassostreae]OAD44188.1 hypothetical protein LPB72_01445 [Hydrogenophaga crassostreae]
MSKNSPDLPAAVGLSESDYALATLRKITVLLGIASTLLIPVVAFTTTNPAEMWISPFIAALSGLTLLLIRTNNARYLTHGVIFVVLIVGTLGVIASGSVRSSVVFMFIGGVAAAGSFLGRRALMAATGYSVVALAALNWAEVAGYIHKANPGVGVKVWATQSICVVVVGLMVYFTRSRAQQAHRFQLNELLRRKETEHERDQAQARFARIFRSSPSPMVAQSADNSLILDVNPAFERCFGYAKQQLVGQSDRLLWVEDGLRRAYTQRLLKEHHQHQQPARGVRSDGTQFEALLSSELSEEPGDRLIITIVSDVSEEKRREAQLLDLATGMAGQTGHAFFTSLVCNMTKTMGADMLFVGELGNSNDVISLAGTQDGAALDRFTYSLDATPCNHATNQSDLCIYPDRVDELFPDDLALAEGQFKAYVGQSLRDETGQPVGILVALWRRPITNHTEVSALMTIYGGRAAAELLRLQRDREIQRLNETLEQRVRERTAELQTLNAELDSFAYSVSHDLKTPLRSIDGFTVLLGETLQGRLSPNEESMFKRILGATSRMGVLIADLLALARISQSELRWQWVDLSELAKDVFATLSTTKFSGRQFDLRVAPNMLAQCDPQLMRIALENLLDNAAKYTRDQPLAVIEFGQEPCEPGAAAAFGVKDNGTGFSMAGASKLFKPFQRLHAPDSGFEGTGIGLATVRRIVERHGGTIRARSDTGQGAAFTLTLGHPPAPRQTLFPPANPT